MQGLVEDYIREEVFYREGRAAGLDRDDVVIRRRVRQKMEFLAEDMTGLEPSEEQLAAHLQSYPERFASSERLTFRHVFLSATRRGVDMENDAKQLANQLADATAAEDAAAFGDPFLLGEAFGSLSQSEVARIFGDNFAKQISTVEQGRWQGPIPSGFGLHFVFLDERSYGHSPPLDSVREAVKKEWLNERRLEAEQTLYRKLRDRYEIIVEAARVKTVRSEAKQ
jgi:parvulin-like peptidyl-prolyl cis-trans isomerase-like protein